jgi:vacuolar-type H+-ATPase catalytic subunit A/Vma1
MISLLWASLYQRPLKAIALQCGDVYIPRGVAVPALNRKRQWEFKPKGLSEFYTFDIPLKRRFY